MHALCEKYRVITVDLRGHGNSSKAWDGHTMLGQIRVPTLLFFGVGGNTFLPKTGEYMKKQIPESKLVIYEKSGHCLHLEETEKFNLELHRRLNSQ